MLESPSNAIRVLESRYLQKDERGVIRETPSQLFDCVAKAELTGG